MIGQIDVATVTWINAQRGAGSVRFRRSEARKIGLDPGQSSANA
jgi:hypothetical protein